MPRVFQIILLEHHKDLLEKINKECARSNEIFVEHFKNKYGVDHSNLPLWMVTEILTFGNLLTMFRGSPKSVKQVLALNFGVAHDVLESWLVALNSIRNACAHHARLWDRYISNQPTIPRDRKHPQWHAPIRIPADNIFGIMTILKYCLDKVASQSKWKNRLVHLLKDYSDIPLIRMGFPVDWENLPLWK